MADPITLIPEEQYTPSSIYGAFKDLYDRTGSVPTGYGQLPRMYGDSPDTDRFGLSSTQLATSGVRPLTSNEVGGLRLDDGSWISRDELMRTERGRALAEAEERIRRGMKRGFWDSVRELSWTDLVPFVGMLSKVGGEYSAAKTASDFFRKQNAGIETTRDEAIAGTLYRRENHLATEGNWGYTFGSIVRQAPAFFMEFGLLGKAGQAIRSGVVRGIVKTSTDEAAKSAATWGVTRFVKIGADEYAESAIRSYASSAMKNSASTTFLDAVKELSGNSKILKQTIGSVAELTDSLMKHGANSVAGVHTWAPGLQAKTSQVIARKAVSDALYRLSSDTVVKRAWRGTVQSVRRAVAEGFIDLGRWGTDAATTINTGMSSASKAALNAVTQLTFGALARGSALYLPKEAATQTISWAVGGKGASTLALEAAAWQNNDDKLMDLATTYGAFLDLLEYVSENTGRGFNSAARAIGLKVAPGLMRPAAKSAGLTHIVSADITRNSSGEATKVVYNGLIESSRSAEAGGKFRQFIEKAFGKRALRENVQNDRYKAVKFVLGDINVGDDVALQKTIDSGVIQPGLSEAASRAMGPDVQRFVRKAVEIANKANLEGRKYNSFMTYYIADFLTRHNIDAIAAGDLFRTMGYDGIIAEMMEERYTDFASALFGLDARRDHGFVNNLRRAVKASLAFEENETGETVWKWDQLTAEAAAFAVPLVARAGTMRAIASLGGPNAFERFKSDASLYADATRYGNVVNMTPGDYLESIALQRERLSKMSSTAKARYNDEMSARASSTPDSNRVPLDENTMVGLQDTVKRADEAVRRLDSVKDHFMRSVTSTSDMYTVPVITDQDLLAPPESYNLMLKTRESQSNLRTSMSAYQTLVDHAPEMFQTMAKMEDRDRVNEDAGWFRRASHWIVEHAIRLGGVAVTGDISFLSINPARFSAVDLGVPGDVLTRGQSLYENALAQRLRDLRREKADGVIDGSSDGTAVQADYEEAHRLALEDIKYEARSLMTTALAIHQARMFSGDEIRDIAMQEVARQDGYATDALTRRFVSPSGEEVSFTDYLSRSPEGSPSVRKRIDDLASVYTKELYSAITSGEGAHRTVETSIDGAVRSVQDILTIPKDLPTANQAIIAKIARSLPQLRSVMIARDVDGTKSLDDHFNEVSVDRRWFDSIVSAVLPTGSSEITSDTDMDKVYDRVANVHPAILASVARDLNIRDNGTRDSIEARNRAIARLAVMSSVSEDKDLKTFARMATEAERSSRLASPFGVSAPARFNGTEWVSRISDADTGSDRIIRDRTVEGLSRQMADAGYTETSPRTVFTSVKLLQSGDALELVRVLGLGSEYERRMEALPDMVRRDPLLRKDDDGNDEFADEDSASVQREVERVKSSMYEARKSADPALYLQPGERLTRPDGTLTPEGKRASVLANDCKECWFRRNGRSEDGSEPLGYIAVAEDLLREYGVTIPFSSTDNSFGVASQGRRGKYTISIRSAQSRGLSRNVYVPIDHENAQDYESALLESSLYTEYAKHRVYLSEVYRSQAQAFMDHVSDVCDKVSTSYAAQGNDRVADLINDFRISTVARSAGRLRLPSPSTFAQFVSAFNLFRTEVPGVMRQSVLGKNAEALCAIAKDVRQGTAFLGWTAVVDRILGGTGLEVSALDGAPPKIGLGRYYALWAPHGSKTLDKAIEDAVPGGLSFKEFSDRASRQAQATVQSAYESSLRTSRGATTARDSSQSTVDTTPPASDLGVSDGLAQESTDPSTMQAPAVGPLSVLSAAQRLASSADLDAGDTLDVISDIVGERPLDSTRTDDSQAPSSDVDVEDEWDETVEAHIDDDEYTMISTPDDYFDVSDTGVATVRPPDDHASLTPSETKAAVQTFSQMAVSVYGLESADQLTIPAFSDFVRTKIAANPRKVDIDSLTGMFKELRRAKKLSTDVSWSLNDLPDKDEEGIMPDGNDGSSQRSVEILKSKALSNWLAMFSVVSPQTGRDFQPLVEDIRSVLRAAPYVMEDRTADLEEADEFLTAIVNPRGESSVDNAPARDTMWRHRMSWFEHSSGHRKDIVRYIRAYLGDAGKIPVNARAALLLSYLMSVADKVVDGKVKYDAAVNVRMSIASLIGSSAPAQPVRLNRTEGFGIDGNFNFRVSPRRRRGGYSNMDSVVGSFSRLAGMSGVELVKLADYLEGEFQKNIKGLTGKQMYGGRNGSSFTTWAKILAPVFGLDSPIVSVFLSRPMYGVLFSDSRATEVLRGGFSSQKTSHGATLYNGIPFAAYQLVDSIRRLGLELGTSAPTAEQLNFKAVELFQSGAPSTRSMANMESTLQGQSVWSSLFRAYADARPVSVMTAEVDPERTSKPASSLAITMPGVEPALLEFMDRKDANGYESVLRKWFSSRFENVSDEGAASRVADWRQRMIWPDSSATLIVAKSISKSALASEILNGCQTSYNEGSDRNVVYVPVYSGDHSSSIIIQVPLLKEFKSEGMSYDDVAEMVSSWVGLDLLGTDAKRSAVTCMEAPGTSMWDYEYTRSGDILTEARQRVIKKSSLPVGKWKLTPASNGKGDVTAKDQDKFNQLGGITKYLGFGKEGSSTDHYGKTVFSGIWNTGKYSEDDVVGVSVNGNSRGRVPLSDPRFTAELDRAVSSGVTFVTDTEEYRGKSSYNVGERELSKYLSDHGYSEINGLGVWVPSDSPQVRGHAYVAIVWNSDPGANNEAMIGTSGVYGYGARRQKELAKDSKSSTLKVHIASTSEDPVYGPVLTLIKSLAVSPDRSKGRGQFLECAPMGFISDHAWSLIKGEEHRSTVTITDFDSIKLSQANSKTVGVDDGNGKPVALMKHVFSRLSAALDAGGIADENGNVKEIGSEISGDELDNLVGDIKWVNLGGSGKRGTYRLSQLLSGVKIKEVNRYGSPKDYEYDAEGPDGSIGKRAGRMFSLVFEADNQMAFQVANVSHKAKAEFSRTPRNYMTDALAAARVLPGHNGGAIFKGADRVCSDVTDLITSWGFTAAAISSNSDSIDNLLSDDEEWISARDKGEPFNGDYALDLRQRKFASEARKNNLAIQFFNSSAPLVTNSGWIGSDGIARSHSSSRMFNDTLQGSRTIRKSDREFMRGNKRVALANVNNVDPWFRYGAYVNEDELLSKFSDIVEKIADRDRLPRFRLVVEVLDKVVSVIMENEYSGVYGKNNAYRKTLAECLIDHHGNPLSDRYSVVDVVKTYKDGRRETAAVRKYFWETVSYADLFTSATSSTPGKMDFDRTAVYESMFNDTTGRSHVYLGGTMMGLPRTPSYNGSMWLQCVRAALPVTERVDADGKNWNSGLDAMVSPDPFTLAILGCDHDGDKTNLYMLRPGGKGSFDMADVSSFTDGIDDFISRNSVLSPKFSGLSASGKSELVSRINKLIDLGYLEYETKEDTDSSGAKTKRTIGLRLSQQGRTRISNTFVSGLFDMNRMLPVSNDSENEVPVYDGYRSNGETRGSMFHGVKATPAPNAPKDGSEPNVSTAESQDPSVAWDKAMAEEGVLGEPLLDAKSGKIIGRPRTAVAVQDGAAVVSEARAIVVSMAGALHFAYMSGLPIGPFSTRQVSEQDWIDFMYHVDGLSNMTFDDIKEQLCTRLGIRPNMIESVLADIINSAEDGSLPTTDSEFIRAFVRYGKAFNDEKSSRHWMARASNPADFRFRAEFDRIVPGYFDSSTRRSADLETTFGVTRFSEQSLRDGSFADGTVASMLQEWCLDLVSTGASQREIDSRYSAAENILWSLVAATSSVKDPLNGFTYWLTEVADESERYEAFDDIGRWLTTVGQLDDAKDFGNSINYMHVDPASNTSASEAHRLTVGYNRTTGRFVDDSDPRAGDPSGDFVTVPTVELSRVRRMRAATAMMYDDSIGLIVAARGVRAADSYHDNLCSEIINYGRSRVNPESMTRHALGIAAFAAAPRLSSSDVMECEANMQSVPWTAAAIATCPSLPGSPITSRNLYDVMDYIGRSLAVYRHSDTALNVSLDVRYGIEAMTDVVARLVLNSSVHQAVNIFDFFKEVPDANTFGYTVEKYGPAAHGLSRVTPAFQHVTEAQRSEIASVYSRVVDERALDSSSRLIKAGWESARGDWKEPGMNFTLSSDNLKKVYSYLARQPIVRNSTMSSNPDKMAKSIEEGNRRDILKTVRELVFVFSGQKLNPKTGAWVDVKYDPSSGKLVPGKGNLGLEHKFGKGFSIEPSSLFGQILPVYACLTSRVTGPAGTDSNSILAVMPDSVYRRLSTEVARVHNNYRLNRISDLGSAMNLAPVAAPEGKGPVKNVKTAKAVVSGMQSVENELHKAAHDAAEASRTDARVRAVCEFVKLSRDEVNRNVPFSGRPDDPTAHHTLCVFDGVRGVAFRSMLSMLSGAGNETVARRTPLAQPAAAQPAAAQPAAAQPAAAQPAAAQPAAAQPAAAQPETTVSASSAPVRADASRRTPKPIAQITDEFDPVVQDAADRMSALLRMWDGGRVEYKGGNTFSIFGNFTDADRSVYETRVDVEVCAGASVLTDSQLLEKVKNSPVYRQSLSVKSGVPEEDIERMDTTERFRLAKRFAPVGFSRTIRPGGTHESPGVLTSVGGWKIDADTVGVLTNRIKLAHDSGDSTVIYHEFFHSVMGFMRSLGSLGDEDIKKLNSKYGDSAKYGKGWFNEEKAAEDFRKFVTNSGIAGTTDGTSTIWDRIVGFLNSLYDLVFTQKTDSFGNDMDRNPLSGIVLTGRVVGSSGYTSEKKDFGSRMSKAVSNYVGVLMARGDWNESFIGRDLGTRGIGNSEYFAELRDDLLGAPASYWEQEIGDEIEEDDVDLTREALILTSYFSDALSPEDKIGKSWVDLFDDKYSSLYRESGTDSAWDIADEFCEFIDTVEMFYSQGDKYAEMNGVEAANRQKRLAMDQLVRSTPAGELFRTALVAFTKKYGPTVLSRQTSDRSDLAAPEQTPSQAPDVYSELDTADTVPNVMFDSDIASALDGAVPISAEDVDDASSFYPDDEEFACASVHAAASDALSRIVPTRMNRPYAPVNSLAMEIGKVIASGLDRYEIPDGITSHLSRGQTVALSADQSAVVRNAVRQVGSLFGVDVSDPTKVDRTVFRAMCELYQMVSPDGTLRKDVNLADGSKEAKRSLVTPPSLSSAIVSACGVRPCDILDATISDVRNIARKYDGQPESTFVKNVINPILSSLGKVRTEDPANVMYDGGSTDTLGPVLSSIRAGLTDPKLDADGVRGRFELGTPGASDNPYHDDNISAYSDHIDNPDFQYVMHTVLDRLYTMQAAMRWYRNIGLEPGNPEDTIAIRGVAPSFVEPMTQADTMASLSVTPEQFANPYFSPVDFYDQPAFVAQHPDAWLDSVTRPNFGNTTLREAAQEEKRQISGFHVRAEQLDGIIIRALGLDVMPGSAVTAIDPGYVSKFSMDAGKTVRKDGAQAIKFLAYDGKVAKRADGSPIVFDLNDQRRSDMTYKMWKVMAQGGRFMVTGVDGLTFSVTDSDDPAHYTIEAVRERAEHGVANGYTDFDRFLMRMDWQLRRDPDLQWDDLLGDSGLNLYSRVVDAACAAIREAKRLNSTLARDGVHHELEAGEVNDFVLRRLTTRGLIQSVERTFGNSAPVRTSGALVISVDEWVRFWENSSTYGKLVEAGRDERTLKFAGGSVAKELMALFDDVRRFVDAHPYLSDGDGAFFHNVSTPLPWVGGDGYTMYALNRNERDKSDLVKNVESMNEYEKTFYGLIGQPSLLLPAADADDNVMRLFKVLFHTQEQDVESVREAMSSGKYAAVPQGATQRDLALAIYDRLSNMIWRSNGDVTLDRVGGHGAVRRMLTAYGRRSLADGVVAGGAGLTDEAMYRMSGKVPANHQLGHAVKNAINGITNAFAFRSTLFNMLTTPDENGRPTCYARPSDESSELGGIPDSMWGVVARWWAETNGFGGEYDINLTGVKNAQHIYDLVAKETVGGVRTIRTEGDEKIVERYGELSNSDIDARSVTAFMARTDNPQDESDMGSYALGYAKHLFQSTRTLGHGAVAKQIHRGLAWSKGLSVNFSYFFPLATRFESPTGAVGGISTFGGNVSPDWMRKHANLLRKLQSPFGKEKNGVKAGWITQDFLGQKDVMQMLDSNDPYLAELYHWAGVLGIQLSDPDVNPQEHSRSYLRQDLDRVVKYVGKAYGTTAAKNVKEIMSAVLLKSGDRAFTYHLNATKLATVAQLCTKLQVAAARAGKAFDPVRDLKKYSAYVNAEIGGIDPLQFSWAHPVMQSVMNSTFFSWGWTRGAWEAGGGPVLEQLLFGGHDVTPEQRRYYMGRWARMFGEIMIGFPMVLQVACKIMGLALVAGLDPDDESMTPEERKRLAELIRKVHESPWFTWQNEDKAWLTQYDITPLMLGITARFPSFSRFIGKDHPWVKTAFGLGAAVTRNPLLLIGAMPTYEGLDYRNSTTMGRRYYQHFGKQGWEELRWFDNPVKQFFSKLSMPVQRIAEGVIGRSLTYLDHPQPWDSQGDFERWLNPSVNGATFNLLRAFVPFSVSSLWDTSDAGFLSMVAPVSMGASGSDVKKRLSSYIGRWAANDRRGYEYGGMSRRKGENMGAVLSRKSVTVAHLVNEAMTNGYTEKEAYQLVNDAVAANVKLVYRDILAAMPTEPDGDFDAVRMSALLRRANRLGRLRKDMFTALRKRLEMQQRWGYMKEDAKRRMKAILTWGQGRDSYDTEALDKVAGKRYDY